MVNEAEKYSDEDKKRRKDVEERNEADSLAYQVERQLKEHGDNLPVHEKARVEQLLNDLKVALKENEAIDKIRSLHSDLQQAAHSLSEAAYQKTSTGTPGDAGAAGSGSAGPQQGSGSGDDDVVDAEYDEQ